MLASLLVLAAATTTATLPPPASPPAQTARATSTPATPTPATPTPAVAQVPSSAAAIPPQSAAPPLPQPLSPSPAQIGYLTAGQLAGRCRDTTVAMITYCFAYIAAVYDTMRAYEVWLNQREFCLPHSISQNELKALFLAYMSAYPANSGGLASSVVAVALKSSAPCDLPAPEKADPLPLPRK